MTLSPKSINALLLIKSSLISNMAKTESAPSVTITYVKFDTIDSKGLSVGERRAKGLKSTVRMRHAKPSNAFQRSCQRHDWSSPVF